MSRVRFRPATLLLVAVLTMPSTASAYSVLAHEAVIDALWQGGIAPTLKRRFPATSDQALAEARAYAYGGSLIQDLGYYPFGSRFFSNLVHYVRSGDFVEALIRDARDVNEYAFALGALAHYTSDTLGHPIAVNRVVPIIYPKLREEYGPEVLYADSPSRHVMVEFAFDVVEVARGRFKADVYQRLVGFEVARPVLERAFRETYGLELEDVFGGVDLAVGTYRYAVSRVIPDMTRIAWREKHDEIVAAIPDVTEQEFVYTMTRRQYEDTFGTKYRKPSLLARVAVSIFKIIPKFGPLKPLAFHPLTPDTERLFLESFDQSRARYRASLTELARGQLTLTDKDLDTGDRSVRGVNQLADETYAKLLAEVVKGKVGEIPAALRREINAYYASPTVSAETSRKARKRERDVARHLAALNAATPAR